MSSLSCGGAFMAGAVSNENNNEDLVLEQECAMTLSERVHEEEKAPPPNSSSSSLLLFGSNSLDSNDDVQTSIDNLRQTIVHDIIGNNNNGTTFASPVGNPISGKQYQVPLVYCDQTASNRSLSSVEDYLRQVCLPYYGNTHTNTSITGSQSTAFVAEARQLVAEATNAKITGKASLDVVIFAGNGATSAVELLIDGMGIKQMVAATKDNQNSSATASATSLVQKPVVFIGPYEHHSNLLPWRESGCEICMIPECSKTNTVDLGYLKQQLIHYRQGQQQQQNRLLMGTFTVASNITGKVCDTVAISSLLHEYGALAFFDYATGGSYLDMNMNPHAIGSHKDAIFLSPHKMLGGIGTPGILIVKKQLLSQHNPPNRSGGGTVFYVTQTHHRFLSHRVHRNEGGTPNIAGILRTGLTVLVKRQVENQYQRFVSKKQRQGNQSQNEESSLCTIPESILDQDYATYQMVRKELASVPNICLLGQSDDDIKNSSPNLPIFSFLIKCGSRWLHYNYVCALLNDIFGIQSRGGCQCAGPYAQSLLGLTDSNDGKNVPTTANQQIEHALVHVKERAELLRPGFTRLSLPFKGTTMDEVKYVIYAIKWIAHHGWKFKCVYRCNHRTGEWRHKSRQGKPLGTNERKWLSHYTAFQSPKLDSSNQNNNKTPVSLQQAMENANAMLQDTLSDLPSIRQALKLTTNDTVLGDELEHLRWYVYPNEVAKYIEHEDVVPGTNDCTNLKGAIQPRGFGTNIQSSSRSNNTSDSTMRTDKEITSTTNLAPAMPALSAPQTTFSAESGKLTLQKQPTNPKLSFRDGDYTGEAPLDELMAGVDDGELSEQMQVYDANNDTWVSLTEYTKAMSMNLSAKEETNNDTVEMQVDNDEKKLPAQNHIIASTESSAPSTQNLLPLDQKNQQKKPPRDSSMWGKGSFVPVEIKPTIPSQQQQPQQGQNEQQQSATSQDATSKKKKRFKHVKPPPKIMRLMTQAMIQWNMIEEGDRLLLGLSGGKDSLSLLHCLLEFQRKLPIKFDIEVCTIDPMTPSFDPSPLIPYVESLGLKYHYIKDDIVDRANKAGKDGKMVSSLCAFCARMKRGNLYSCARRNNCNKLVLAQHLDDLAESFMMSVMHNGFLRTMKANYKINAGDLSVIRPLAYCRESLMTEFAKSANLPIINENCPACFEEPKERARIKKLLSREETLYPNFYDNIRRSLLPLMHDDATAILRCYTEETLARSKKNERAKKRPGTDHSSNNKKVKSENGQGAATKQEDDNDNEEEKKLESMAKSTSTTTADNGAAEKELEGAIGTSVTSAGNADNDNNRLLLADASEEELIRELARRKADRYRLAGAMKRLEDDDDDNTDPTGQVCSLNGGNGTIPCRELME